MKLLWLCNMAPGAVDGKPGAGLWMDRTLEALRKLPRIELLLLCGDGSVRRGTLDDRCRFETFLRGEPQILQPERVFRFRQLLREFRPDVIHIWGTEFAHSLDMVRAAEAEALLPRVVISLQGVCSAIALHYCEGLPHSVQVGWTLRDLLRRDNIRLQQRKFALRGAHEGEALEKVGHVIGRTRWDRVCARQLHPGIRYHACNETLREPFYEGKWQYADCRRHRIFASSCSYPVKGFHYLLEAFAQVLKQYPDAVLAVPGKSYLAGGGLKELRHRTMYQNYLEKLTRQYGLAEHIEFLGRLSAQEMKQQYLLANVFVLPSTVENSPNSLGEAMLLGTPCVAAHVGGVDSLMGPGEGLLYQSSAPYMLADAIGEVFSRKEQAEQMGRKAAEHGRITHDPEKNLEDLLDIYEEVQGREE